MNIVRFTWLKAPALIYAYAVLIGGTIAAIATKDWLNITIAFSFLLVVHTIAMLGQSKHLHGLEVTRLARLIERVFHNNEHFGHPTPTEAAGRAYIAAARENPLVDYHIEP